MNEQRAERTRALIASYRYSVNRLEPQKRRARPMPPARESPIPRQINVEALNGSVMERRSSRPTTPAIIDKEALENEMMNLKKLNKVLKNQNHKLKTNNTRLKQQVIQAKEDFEKKPKNRHLVRTESAHTRRLFFELNQTKQENAVLKQEMQCARLHELKTEKQENTAQIKRLKEQLQQEKERNEKLNQYLRENKEKHSQANRKKQDIIQMLEQENNLLRQNNMSAANRIQKARNSLQTKKVEPINQAMLEIKAKNKQIESLKNKVSQIQQQSNYLRIKLNQQQEQLQQLQAPKPAQQCKKCTELKSYHYQNKQYAKKIEALSKNTIINERITVPTVEQSDHFRTFLTLKLSALQVTLEEAIDYFFGEPNDQKMTLFNLISTFISSPLGQMSNRYIQILAFHLCLKDQSNNNQTIVVKEKKTFPMADIKHNFRQFLGEFTVPSQQQRYESIKRFTDLFKDKIYTIFDELKKGTNQDETTISFRNFNLIMRRLEVDEDCIVEMVRIMVESSTDLNKLNCLLLFDTFGVEEAYLLHNIQIQRNLSENRANPNPEAVLHTNIPNEEEDITFMKLDPSKLFPTQQDFQT